MPRGEAAPIRVVYPIWKPEIRRRASKRAAEVRRSIRKTFPDDKRYLNAFQEANAHDIGTGLVNGKVRGIMLLKRKGLDSFTALPARFKRQYGPVMGRVYYWRYAMNQRLAADGDVYLASIWVSPKARNLGLGHAMLSQAQSHLGGHWTALARNEKAVRFFERAGFTRRKDVRGFLLGKVTRCTPMEWRQDD